MSNYTIRLYKKASHAGVCLCLAFMASTATAGLTVCTWLDRSPWFIPFGLLTIIFGVQAILYGRKALQLHRRATDSDLQDIQIKSLNQP